MEPIVVFDGVWKKFRRGERHDSLRDLIPAAAAGLFRRRRPSELAAQEFWALKDVSFEVRPGEALGIIGPNGAGKSTTLKLLTRILEPTRGHCEIRGRAGALIEVAAGFHPDLTGRENIYLQGAIMGMRRAEITAKLEEIIEFAGVGEFVDTPVKRYSSGMNARLGFAIAAHVDPEVLVIDEVLSVGDMSFQQKCIDRMLQFKRRGVAIVFVSHNLQAVAGLCDRALFLRGGAERLGTASEVIEYYVRSMADGQRSSAQDGVQIVDSRLTDERGREAGTVAPGSELQLRLGYIAKEDLRDLTFGFVVYRSTDNLVVFDGNFTNGELGIPMLAAGRPANVSFRFRTHLTRGQYHVVCHVFHNPTQAFMARLCPAAVFGVEEQRSWAGVADLDVRARADVETGRPAWGDTRPSRAGGSPRVVPIRRA